MKVTVGISRRHIHLTNTDINKLFGNGYELTKLRDLSQKGQFASNELLTIKTDKGEIKDVRVLGPARNYTQVEITKTDSYILGINPPVRESGDLNNSETVTIEGPNGTIIATNSTIIANRHIHINDEELKLYNFKSGEKVKIKIMGEKGAVLENVVIKSDPSFTFELHLDTDDANAVLLKNKDEVEIIKGE